MATGKRILISGIKISDAGTGSNATTYNLTRDEAIEITNEREDLTVEAGQTILASINSGFTARTLDDALLSDTHVQTDGATTVAEARFELVGAGSADTYRIDNLRLSAHEVFDDLNKEVEIVGTKIDTGSSITTV